MKPEDVLHNWAVPSLANPTDYTIKRASSGLLNKTFIIRAGSNGEELYILQSVHPAVSMDGAMHNYFHVTQFLKEKGLPTQILLKTQDGKLWIDDVEQNWRWRLLEGVEGEVYEKTESPYLTEEAGKLLGKFHATMALYKKRLEIGRLSFRYQREIIKLNHYKELLMADEDKSLHSATELVLSELPKLLLPNDLPKITIHADPKISNFVFTKDGKGVCMIDFDTVQELSPLYDIGDGIRSWCGQKEDDPNNTFNEEKYKAFLQGYMRTSKGLLSEREYALIPQAVRGYMLDLTARFLNDYIEDSYFGWDETRYNSRKAHNKARAMGQISLYQSSLKAM